MKKILILGGTMFVGRMVTERLIASGQYDVTLFNRGKSNVGLFKDVKQIHGDRETADIEQVFGQQWDCIIDFSGYYPETFAKLLDAIAGNVGRYIFISTISVFDIGSYSGQLITEDFATLDCTDEQKVSALPAAYGEKKAEMERLLLAHPEMDPIIFRPSFIYGRYDHTERFYYWLYRVERCAQILLPDGGSSHSISLTNADDLARALIMAIGIGDHDHIYHAISTPAISIREMLRAASVAFGRAPEIITTTPETLESQSASPPQFPLLMPIDFTVSDRLWLRDFPFTRADMSETFLDMRDHKAASDMPVPRAGIDPTREQELIESIAKA